MVKLICCNFIYERVILKVVKYFHVNSSNQSIKKNMMVVNTPDLSNGVGQLGTGRHFLS